MVDFDKDRDANLSAYELTGGAAHGGLTVRDYFAARSLDLAFKYWKYQVADRYDEEFEWDEDDFYYAAEKAYMIADAMMVARNRNRHVFTEEKLDSEIAKIPEEGIDIVVKEAFGV